jgi:hypothetical protein
MVGRGRSGTYIAGGILETQLRQKLRDNLKPRRFFKYDESGAKPMYIFYNWE